MEDYIRNATVAFLRVKMNVDEGSCSFSSFSAYHFSKESDNSASGLS